MTPLSDFDAELMLAFQRGNEDAFTSLFERYRVRVTSIAYRFIADREVAEDVAQEVFVKVYASRKSYRPRAKFSTWLYRITANTCLDELRKRGSGKIAPISEVEMEASPSSPESVAESNELVRQVRAAILSLPENQRIAIILQRYECLSYQEIAEVLNTSVSAVESLLFRAKQSLKTRLASYVELPAESCRPEKVPAE